MPSRGLQHDVNVLGGAWLLRRVIGGGVKIILHTNFILLLLPNSVLSINFCAGQIVEDAQRAALAGSRREHTRHETIPKVLIEALEKTSSSLCRSVRRESSCVPVCGGPPMRTSHRSGEDLPGGPLSIQSCGLAALLPRLSHSRRAARCRRAGHRAVLTLIGEVSLISSRTGEVLTGEVLTGEVLTHTGTQTRSCSVLD